MARLLKLEHSPRPRPAKNPSVYDALKFGFFLFGLPKNGFVSVDVTDDCNLRCKHCYFFEQREHARQGENSLQEWIAFFERMKRCGRRQYPMLQCTWVGGEPLIRKEVIERCKHYFRYNTVVTNGSIPLPYWPEVHFYLSVDGTAEQHDRLRNKRGLYQRIRRHAERTGLDITIACCITRDNWESIEAMVKEWNAVEGVGQMTFDFYTPIETIEHEHWLGWELRDHMVDVLIELKRIYGDFIITPERAFRLMKSDRSQRVTRDCLFARKSTAFGPRGEVKDKCMIGARADCDRCGCVVPFYLQSLVDRPLILREAAAGIRDSVRSRTSRLRAWWRTA